MAAPATRPSAGPRSRLRPRGGPATLNAYFDTSALVKLVVAEPGSDLADEVWDSAELKVSSYLVYPEARAALAAASRAGRIDARGLRRAVADLDAAVASVRQIGVDEALAREAGRLTEEYALRGYDAVHLATSLSVQDRALVFVTWDGELARAALRCGYSVAPALAG